MKLGIVTLAFVASMPCAALAAPRASGPAPEHTTPARDDGVSRLSKLDRHVAPGVRSKPRTQPSTRAHGASTTSHGVASRPRRGAADAAPKSAEVAIDRADPVGEPLRRLKRLTPGPGERANADFADPSIPDTSEPGAITVYGSDLMTWRGATTAEAWNNFLRGLAPTKSPLPLFHADGTTPIAQKEFGEEAWDVTIETFDGYPGQRFLYGGVMTPPPGQRHARWPVDNWSRRTYAFTQRDGRWVRQPNPLFSDQNRNDWTGHNYGHQFIRDEAGRYWVFYEKVSKQVGDKPWKTELFARAMRTPLEVEGPEIPVFTWGGDGYPALVRGFGGTLAEGPRPTRVVVEGKPYYLVSFSGSDWHSDKYGANLLWSERIDGPYRPYLTADGRDLEDFSAGLRARHGLTWGPGRPALFEDPSGKWWVLLTAATRADVDVPDSTPGPGKGPFRNIYLAPVRFGPPAHPGEGPRFEILDAE